MISKRVSAPGSDSLGNDSLEGLLTIGWYLLQHHRGHCNNGVMVDSARDIDRLETWFEQTIAREGTSERYRYLRMAQRSDFRRKRQQIPQGTHTKMMLSV